MLTVFKPFLLRSSLSYLTMQTKNVLFKFAFTIYAVCYIVSVFEHFSICRFSFFKFIF